MTNGLVINKTSEKRIVITDSPLVTRLKKMKRTVITTSRVIQETLTTNRQKFKVAMVTLTYRDDVEWDKRHISTYIDHVRKWAKRRGHQVRYVWVMELTKRGRPHYHVVWWLPKGVSMPMADKQGWWKHGMTNSVWARKPVGYIAKYASKGLAFIGDDAPQLPKGARICGYGGLDLPMIDWKCWILCPSWLKDLLGNHSVRKKGCFYFFENERFCGSPWASAFSYKMINFYGAHQFSVRKKCSYWCVEKTYCYSSPWRYDFIERVLVWRGHQPIYDYDQCFPSFEHSDFNFGVSPLFVPSEPEFEKQAKVDRLRFKYEVDSIAMTGYYDAIDRGFAVCNLKEKYDAYSTCRTS